MRLLIFIQDPIPIRCTWWRLRSSRSSLHIISSKSTNSVPQADPECPERGDGIDGGRELVKVRGCGRWLVVGEMEVTGKSTREFFVFAELGGPLLLAAVAAGENFRPFREGVLIVGFGLPVEPRAVAGFPLEAADVAEFGGAGAGPMVVSTGGRRGGEGQRTCGCTLDGC